mmetsp:Transcript_19146/g.29334  ORF Transcript_19146/g.29334 Transcript_19146/m.29334 type:complete len:177 (+) Transcript_19146:219-749(+)
MQELLEDQVNQKVKRELELLEDRIRPKIKKRIKMKHMEPRLLQKVNLIDFKKQIDRFDNTLQVVEDKVDYKLPAMDYEFTRAMKNKAEMPEVEEKLETKADKEAIEQLTQRLNTLEESFTARLAKAQEEKEAAEKEDEESEAKAMSEADLDSPESPRRKKKLKQSIDTVNSEERER